MSTLNYRSEIDGLRAVAVLSVTFYHSGLVVFKGGYVGVDVFFVISGYLITSIIIKDIDKGSFSLKQFYWRRARRILPALFLVLIVCTPIAWLLMLPFEFEKYSQSLIGVNLFVSNIFFWLDSGYFSAAAGWKPLLHTWSLAVEEQFYLFFPVFLIVISKFGKRAVVAAIILVALASLGLSEWGWRYAPSANFYLTPPRIWELMTGSICSFIYNRKDIYKNNILSSIGLCLILMAVFVFDHNTPYPSIYTAIPVLGTALVILYSSKTSLDAGLLSNKYVVTVGLFSYCAYLWHQPVFAFSRIYNIYEPSINIMIVLALFSLFLGFITWRYFEVPIRSLSNIRRMTKYFLVISTCVVISGVVGNAYLAKQIPFPSNLKWESLGQKTSIIGQVCEQTESPSYIGLSLCYFGDLNADKVIALYGDSHATAISYELDKTFKERRIKGARIKAKGCEDIATLSLVPHYAEFAGRQTLSLASECKTSFESLLHFVRDTVSEVLIINRWSFRVYPVDGYIDSLFVNNGEGGIEPGDGYREFGVIGSNNQFLKSPEEKRSAIKRFFDSLLSLKKPILLVYPIPELGINIVKENARYFRNNVHVLDALSISNDYYKNRNKFIIEEFNKLQDPYIVKIKPEDIFCDTYLKNRCVGQINGTPLYLDDDHLSDLGAQLIIKDILTKLEPSAN